MECAVAARVGIVMFKPAYFGMDCTGHWLLDIENGCRIP